MKRTFLTTIFFFAAITIVFADEYPRPNLLVDVAELAKAKDFVILDVRPAEKYKVRHIPGAIWVDHDTWSQTFAKDQKPATWSGMIGELGISVESKVVIYDDARHKDAARVWWIVRYFGVKDARILNGGWNAWVAEKKPTTSQTPEVNSTKFEATVASERFADKEKVLDILKNRSAVVVDSRSNKEYCGDLKLSNKAGHIPGAVPLEWADAIDPGTQKFKSADELKKMFEKAGIDVAKPAVTHCQSGGRSSVMAFTLELMGAKSVANYYRGWSEWGNSDETPIEATPAPPKKNTK